MRFTLLTLALAGFTLAGCRPSPQPVVQPSTPRHLGRAQTGLPVIKLLLGTEALSTEVCLTAPQRAAGMSFRTTMPENTAMLFPFTLPHRASFHMKNTALPLSAAYIDPEGVILEIHDLKPLDESAVEAGTEQVQYVLEVNQGWFGRHGIVTGVVVRTPQGSLRQAFTMSR